MAEPYLGEIRAFAFNFAPDGWASCDGQSMNIQQNVALFALIGTRFGGDGKTTFLLPDLRGRTPLCMGGATTGLTPRAVGNAGGSENVTLTINQMGAHTHPFSAVNTMGDKIPPIGRFYAQTADGTFLYAPPASQVALAPNAISTNGGGGGHNNMQPFLTLRFCIALRGYFPPRN